MHHIQILLPLCDNQRRIFSASKYKRVRTTLSLRFHGLTAYGRIAAEGLWRVGKSFKKDDIIVYEVMSKTFNAKWWREYRKELEQIFQQEALLSGCKESRWSDVGATSKVR